MEEARRPMATPFRGIGQIHSHISVCFLILGGASAVNSPSFPTGKIEALQKNHRKPKLSIGSACWDACGHVGGYCDACGRGLACCAALNPLNLPECRDVQVDNLHEHQCIVPKESLVDKALYMSLQSENWRQDVTAQVNELLTRNGLKNFTSGTSLNSAFGDPAPGRGKVLRVTKGRRVVDIKEKAKLNPSFDLTNFVLNRDGPLVDSALLVITNQRAQYVNVTDRVNELITLNGVKDVTHNQSLVELLGDPFPGKHKTLVLRRAGKKLELKEPTKGNLVVSFLYDVTPLMDDGYLVDPEDSLGGHSDEALPLVAEEEEEEVTGEAIDMMNVTIDAGGDVDSATGATVFPHPPMAPVPIGQAVLPAALPFSEGERRLASSAAKTLVLDSKVPRAVNHAFIFPDCKVDSAIYVSFESDATADVTETVNELIAANGVRDFTGGVDIRSALLYRSSVLRTEDAALRIEKASRFLQLAPSMPDGSARYVYDLSPLYPEAQTVDGAFFTSSDASGHFINVTAQVNALILKNGISNITNGEELVTLFGDPAPGEEKMLRVVKGIRVLDLMEHPKNPAFAPQYDLMPLLLETGHILPKKSMSWPHRQPSVFVAVFSRRGAVSRRQVIRDMWLRAAGVSGNVTVNFAVCDGDDEYKRQLEHEKTVHGDILFLECSEGYGQGLLTWKVLAAMHAYHDMKPKRDLFMKVDDDTFVAWHHFSSFLMNKGHNTAYIGIPISQGQPCRDPAYRWFEPYETFNESMFPEAMAGGSGYTLGRDLVEAILEQGIGKNNILWNEDRAVGVWVQKLMKSGVPVEYVAVPGVDGFWGWDWRHPNKNWKFWGEYPHLVHHGLEAETIACLAQADASDEPWQPISHCFTAEVGQEKQQLSCTRP